MYTLSVWESPQGDELHFPGRSGKLHTDKCQLTYRQSLRARELLLETDIDEDEDVDLSNSDCDCPPACKKCGGEIDVKEADQVVTKQLMWKYWACEESNLFAAYFAGIDRDRCMNRTCRLPRGLESALFFWERIHCEVLER